MVRLLRRIVLASLLVGGIAFVVRRRRDVLPAVPDTASGTRAHDRSPKPFVEVPTSHRDDSSSSDERPTWVEPVDGACPDGYPIKANNNSGIYHVPGGRFYDRTVPERCYAEAQAAAADGYRAAKA
jgi:hypothetical protein